MASFNQATKLEQGYVNNNGNIQVSVDNISQVLAGVNKLALIGSADLAGVCIDRSGNTYVTDAGRHIVVKIANNGIVSLLAGRSNSAGNNGANTVTAANARFNYPTGICCDSNGDIYVCDTNNNQIRKISNNKVSLVAGSATCTAGTTNGVGSAARFNKPFDIDINPSGVLFVADTFNHSIRKIDGGVVTTFAGLSGTAGHVPVWAQMTTAAGVLGTAARFNLPYAVACTPNGYLYVSDTMNHVIKRIDPAARVRIFSGDGTYGTTIGTAKTSRYQDLKFSDVDKSGRLYIVDFAEGSTSRILQINEEGVPAIIVNYATAYPSHGKYISAIASDAASHLMIIESDYMLLEYSSSSSSSHSSSSSSSSSSMSSSSSSSSYIENWSSSSESTLSSSSSSYIENWSSSSESTLSSSSSSTLSSSSSSS